MRFNQSPLHMSTTAEWLTPVDIIERARKAMGCIHTDPATTEFANQWVKAETIYTKEDNGLGHEWHGRVFLNPPGDKRGLMPKEFFRKLVAGFFDGDVERAVYVGFSLSQLQMIQLDPEWGRLVAQGCTRICVCSRRPRYRDSEGVEQKHPTHGGFVAFLGLPGDDMKRFHAAFRTLGQIFIPEAL